ncbi:hypothetical protein MNBD_BACTEROID01-2266 [hydrothermal vent metagenome]|uniref:DUF2271 domain-containing protein n=1 Tax=hydrothermal vent metagenome TaxID=652676 RepID=A0A3B0TIX3_9ZZZZ
MKKTITILIIALLATFGCSPPENPKLEFSFQVNKTDSVMPSYQVAIWLEKLDGEYVKTLFVSDYLSYGGFNIEGVCPIWVKKSQWGSAPQEMVDAVTQATPDIGNALFEFDIPKNEVPNGEYKYFIEIHITEDYNELYSGDIKIEDSGNDSISEAVVTYLPKRYPKASGLLSNVKVRYNINKN